MFEHVVCYFLLVFMVFAEGREIESNKTSKYVSEIRGHLFHQSGVATTFKEIQFNAQYLQQTNYNDQALHIKKTQRKET